MIEIFSGGLPLLDTPVLAEQQVLTFVSSTRTPDAVSMTKQERWRIGTDDNRERQRETETATESWESLLSEDCIMMMICLTAYQLFMRNLMPKSYSVINVRSQCSIAMIFSKRTLYLTLIFLFMQSFYVALLVGALKYADCTSTEA